MVCGKNTLGLGKKARAPCLPEGALLNGPRVLVPFCIFQPGRGMASSLVDDEVVDIGVGWPGAGTDKYAVLSGGIVETVYRGQRVRAIPSRGKIVPRKYT